MRSSMTGSYAITFRRRRNSSGIFTKSDTRLQRNVVEAVLVDDHEYEVAKHVFQCANEHSGMQQFGVSQGQHCWALEFPNVQGEVSTASDDDPVEGRSQETLP